MSSAISFISIILMLAGLAQMQPMNWAAASKRGAHSSAAAVSGEIPVISISSVLRDPRQLPFNQLFAGSDWHGKVLNQIQGYNELFRDLGDVENGRRRRRSAAANERREAFGGMNNDDSAIGYWKTNLLELQEKAPKPKMVKCSEERAKTMEKPECYGLEFHGHIAREEAEKLLFSAGEGAFLVRASRRSAGASTLCILFDGAVLNYMLFFDGAHYVGDKRFDDIEMLVQDGLICMYVEKHASDYIKKMADEAIYEQSPYSQHNRSSDQTNGNGKRRQIARCHNFLPFTFKMPHYCDFCRNFLWGLVQQGVRCSDCGFSAHRKCSEKARNDCQPEAKYVKRMFAVDLTTLCLAHGVRIPLPLQCCIEEVERRGLMAEGIYRVSGSFERIDKLRRQFDFVHSVDLAQEEDIHTVAGLLKLYLRLLPQQLVPFSVFRSLLKAYTTSKETPERIRNCRDALAELSEANRDTFRALLVHLRKVADNSAENKMSAENLATIFSPTIFCTGNFPFPALPNQQHVLLHFLIVNKSLME